MVTVLHVKFESACCIVITVYILSITYSVCSELAGVESVSTERFEMSSMKSSELLHIILPISEWWVICEWVSFPYSLRYGLRPRVTKYTQRFEILITSVDRLLVHRNVPLHPLAICFKRCKCCS